MKTKKEVLSWCKDDNEINSIFGDSFGVRLAKFLSLEEMNAIGIKPENPKKHIPLEWTRENILKQLEEDVEAGFDMASEQREMSASLMFDIVRKWNKVLEEGLQHWRSNNYGKYGLPLFKATAVKYGFENHIGDLTGRERCFL